MSRAAEIRIRLVEIDAERDALLAELTYGDCQGTGYCHGARVWCDNCGDVREICENPGACDAHTALTRTECEPGCCLSCADHLGIFHHCITDCGHGGVWVSAKHWSDE